MYLFVYLYILTCKLWKHKNLILSNNYLFYYHIYTLQVVGTLKFCTPGKSVKITILQYHYL